MTVIHPLWLRRAVADSMRSVRPEWRRPKRGWLTHLPEMILWYSTAGTAVLSGAAADSMVERVRSGRPLPPLRQVIWVRAQRLARRICATERTNPVDWLNGGCGDIHAAWKMLDDIPGIGPKIASFIMREFSFLRDYSSGAGGPTTSWRRIRDREWFDALSERQ